MFSVFNKIVLITKQRYHHEEDLCELIFVYNKLCAWQQDMPTALSSHLGHPSASRAVSRCNVAVVSHAQYVLTVTAAPA